MLLREHDSPLVQGCLNPREFATPQLHYLLETCFVSDLEMVVWLSGIPKVTWRDCQGNKHSGLSQSAQEKHGGTLRVGTRSTGFRKASPS